MRAVIDRQLTAMRARYGLGNREPEAPAFRISRARPGKSAQGEFTLFWWDTWAAVIDREDRPPTGLATHRQRDHIALPRRAHRIVDEVEERAA